LLADGRERHQFLFLPIFIAGTEGYQSGLGQ